MSSFSATGLVVFLADLLAGVAFLLCARHAAWGRAEPLARALVRARRRP